MFYFFCFLEQCSRKTVRLSEQIMSADKYASMFPRQMDAIVRITIFFFDSVSIVISCRFHQENIKKELSVIILHIRFVLRSTSLWCSSGPSCVGTWSGRVQQGFPKTEDQTLWGSVLFSFHLCKEQLSLFLHNGHYNQYCVASFCWFHNEKFLAETVIPALEAISSWKRGRILFYRIELLPAYQKPHIL